MLKLGVIGVLNALPVYYQLIENPPEGLFEPCFGKVTELNRKLNQGALDLSVVSSFEYALNADQYYVLPGLSISAMGPVKSIYLFSDRPLGDLRGQTIRLTEFSLTSVHLIQYLLQDLAVRYTHDPEEPHAAELLIADEAIRRFYRRSDAYVYDLGQLWKDRTGLPFVFALWVVRRQAFEREPQAVHQLHAQLLKSRDAAKGLLEEIAQNRHQGVFPDAATCLDYLANLDHHLGPAAIEGFLLFQEKMVGIGKLPRAVPLSLLPE
ncbi:MAG: menaquinone biosynthesis protein [bacterium]|nr:menaquinone biosynthesis protein [bacterium]